MKFSANGRHGSLDSFAALQEWADRNIQLQIDLNCSGGCIFGSLAAELVPTEDDVRDELVAVYDELIGLLRAGLAAMRKRGDLRADADPNIGPRCGHRTPRRIAAVADNRIDQTVARCTDCRHAICVYLCHRRRGGKTRICAAQTAKKHS